MTLTPMKYATIILHRCRQNPTTMGDEIVRGIKQAMEDSVKEAQGMLAEAERQVVVSREALEKITACESGQGLYATEIAKDALHRMETDLASA